jgi:hypothetical protein
MLWGDYKGQYLLLALIITCNTNDKDAALETVLYRMNTFQTVVNLRTVTSKIGQVKTRGGWGIINRSTDITRTVFVDSDNQEEDL